MKNELISIIVPVYNVEKYLEKCLDSITNQTYKNLEIIVVDDGSTDKSGIICDKYAQKDNRIKVIHKINGGLSDARNAGLDICTGDYIGFVDSDDYIESDMYEYLLENLRESKSDVSMCSYCIVDDNDNKNFCFSHHKNIVFNNKIEILNNQLENAFKANIAVWNKLFVSNIFNNLRFSVGKCSEDSFLLLNWVERCERAIVGEKIKYYYRHRADSLSSRKVNKHLFDEAEAFRKILNNINIEYLKTREICKACILFSYKISMERLISDNSKKRIFYKKYIQRYLRKNILTIVNNNYISKKDKIILMLMLMDYNFYYFMKKLYQRIK